MTDVAVLSFHSLHLLLFLFPTLGWRNLLSCLPTAYLYWSNYVGLLSLSLSLCVSLSLSLSVSLFHSPSLHSSHLGDSSMHAAANLSRCLSGCSVYVLCSPLLSSALLSSSSALPCTLHCTHFLTSPSLLLSFSTCIFPTLYALISVVHCRFLFFCLWRFCSLLSLLVPEEEDLDAPCAPAFVGIGLFGYKRESWGWGGGGRRH